MAPRNTDQQNPTLITRSLAILTPIGNFLAAIFLGGNYRFRDRGSIHR